MPTFTCRYGEQIEITPLYITYRNRLINVDSIKEFRVSSKKFLINSFKQNNDSPTMCIHMSSHDDALTLFDSVLMSWYIISHKDVVVPQTSFLDWLFKSD